MIPDLLTLLLFFAFLEASKVVLNEERRVELANRHVVVACHQQNSAKHTDTLRQTVDPIYLRLCPQKKLIFGCIENLQCKKLQSHETALCPQVCVTSLQLVQRHRQTKITDSWPTRPTT